ncbi:Transcriptional regulatory protein [Sporothrix stenoceras]|uniref:Transcriptional regulatory protein n=1 Tax=Sporothrix stenoceras TaxID=5173 RepID=A0ABR3ZEE1_9PEZI
MAADEEPADVAAASSPPLGPLPDNGHDQDHHNDNDHSPSNASSPLTEVEDKDGEPDEMDLDGPVLHNSSSLSNVNLDDEEEDQNGARSHSGSDNDESALSEVEADADINDSEAETERLYDTPTKAKNLKDGVDAESSPESISSQSPTKQRLTPTTRGDRTAFQASPSKLKQQLHADSDADQDEEEEEDEDDALSEAEDEENNEADGEEEAAADDREATRSSRRRSLAAKEQAKKEKVDANGDKEETPVPMPALLRSQRSNSDTRKRKRSPTTDPSESDQPLRKRIGSSSGSGGAGAGRDATTSIAEDVDSEKVSTKRAANGVTDDDVAETGVDEKAEADNSAEGTNSDTFRARRSKRGSAKKRNNSDDGDDDANEDNHNDVDTLEDGDLATAEEDAAGHGDDEPIDGDIDEEAEAAHRNEEELERKKQALENLHAIEKQFASFRDKLYQERLDQLNQEEEMLLGDNPTHPEYLAMMQCVNDRRDEKLRVIDVEYSFNLQTLKRWAVARRSHIHGQYFQSIRESRELVLEELGRQWYQIQQQRRRHANTIPDYGLQFPSAKPQRVKDAITYNTEVSILSGIAKYEGFPAAPQIKGASSTQVDDDLEAIARGRQSVSAAAHIAGPPQHSHAAQHVGHSPFPEVAGHAAASAIVNGAVNPAVNVNSAGVNGAGTPTPVSFHSLGAAGQQFLADTPWANPHHPAHSHVQLQRQQQQQSPVPVPSPAPPATKASHPRKSLPPQAGGSNHTPTPSSYTKSGQPLGPMPSKREATTVSY